jgi:xanthine dehydrogenase accessory factor
MNQPLPHLLRSVAGARRSGGGVAACLIVTARGSTPQPAGALMFLNDAGRIFGTIGGGCLEAEARRRAMMLLGERRSELVRFRLDHDYGWDDGLICGGSVELAIAAAPDADQLEAIADAIERGQPARLALEVQTEAGHERITLNIPPRARLYIAGAGHIGCAVARHAIALDFDITIVDDRPDLLARMPSGARTVCSAIAEHLAQANIDDDAYCLIVTRGHRHDQQALAAVLESCSRRGTTPRYIGMIGSRRKIKVIFDDLESRGTPRQQLASVHAPVGLPIGAQTVEEIAISIAAQLVQVRAGSGGLVTSVERCVVPRRDEAGVAGRIGVLLAAGQGRRMGCTKQLLPLPGDPQERTLVAAAFDAIAASCGRMVVVVAHDADAVLGALEGRSFTAVQAPRCAEMSESVLAGLRAAADLDENALLVLHLSDHPWLSPQALEAILAVASANPGRAVRPTHTGRGGHPVVIPGALVQAILESRLERGLRAWWKEHPEAWVELPLDDPLILTDMDTPEDYLCLWRGPLPARGHTEAPVCRGEGAND